MIRLLICGDSDARVHVCRGPGPFSVGADPACDIVVRARGVSRQHAVLRRDGDAWLLADLGSKNGLIADDQRQAAWALAPGRSIQIGSCFVSLDGEGTGEALALALEASRDASTLGQLIETDVPHDRVGAALALDLTHRLAATAGLADAVLDGAMLDDARRALGADAVLIVAGARPPTVERLAGGLAAAELDAVLTARMGTEGAGAKIVQAAGDRTLAVASWTASSVRSALAVFATRLPPAWCHALLRWLAAPAGSGQSKSRHAETISVDRQRGSTADAPTLKPPEGMVLGTSEAFERLLDDARIAARSRGMSVLITGETGTGKELVARLVHRSGTRAAAPFLAVNCAAVPADLLASQLFGIERGVATGVERAAGLFRAANGGTLFLDEVGELPALLQPKLLRALEEREVLPVGGTQPIAVDVRVVAASNRDLDARAERGGFRPDLLYRLAQLRLHLPPLRERLDDLPALAAALMHQAARAEGKRPAGLGRGALATLVAHDWPGNVRELRDAVARAVLRCPDGAAIEQRHLDLPPTSTEPPPARDDHAVPSSDDPRTLAERIEALERQMITEALERCRGNRSRAAERLGLSRPGLYKKIERLGLDV